MSLFRFIHKMTNSQILKIGTHNGHFHCDEALAVFMLKQLPKYKDSQLVRSRDPLELEKCDIVVDVGGVYDVAKNRFDHHQRTFNETFSSIDSTKPWKIKLSSAGLVYVHFGKEIIEEILKKVMKQKDADKKLIEILFDKMYENFIIEIDAIDNGVEIADNKRYDINTNLSARVSYFNPAWNDKESEEHVQFDLASNFVGKEFEEKIRYYALVWWPARSIVTSALDNRFKIDESGSILHIESSVPWKSHLFDLEKELGLTNNEIKYVIYPDSTNNTWRLQCVPLGENSFTNRLSIKSSWCGLRDDVLSKESGIDGCIFVHANGFIGGNKTYEGALEMLRRCLKEEEQSESKKLKLMS